MVATVETPQKNLTLEEFLARPETKPASEYSRGTVSQKPMPKGKHSTLQFELAAAINQQAKSAKLAYALPELRCIFGGRSIVPDVAVLHWENLPRDEDGEIADPIEQPPEWIIEILFPNQSNTLVTEKILRRLRTPRFGSTPMAGRQNSLLLSHTEIIVIVDGYAPFRDPHPQPNCGPLCSTRRFRGPVPHQ